MNQAVTAGTARRWKTVSGRLCGLPGSYDPELDLVFIGTANTYNASTLIEPQAGKGDSADALYTNSTPALDPDTGELVWYFQHFPGDLWDLDWAFERMIVALPTSVGEKKVVVTVGKLGIFDVLDAKTGDYLFSYDMGLAGCCGKDRSRNRPEDSASKCDTQS